MNGLGIFPWKRNLKSEISKSQIGPVQFAISDFGFEVSLRPISKSPWRNPNALDVESRVARYPICRATGGGRAFGLMQLGRRGRSSADAGLGWLVRFAW